MHVIGETLLNLTIKMPLTPTFSCYHLLSQLNKNIIMFEDTKEEIRKRKSKDRQHTDQRKTISSERLSKNVPCNVFKIINRRSKDRW